MQLSREGTALICQFEGFSPVVYRCPAGLATIGYGHVLTPGEQLEQPMTEAKAHQLLRQDVSIAEHAVIRLISVPLTQGQFDALVSFTFNLGAGALQRSTLRRVINRGDHAAVPTQLMRWVYAAGRILPGLIARRQAESRLYQGR